MLNVTRGKTIKIRCEVQPGAFPTEVLITFQTAKGPISGFVRKEMIEDLQGNQGYITAVVEDVSPDVVTVTVQGSFFTTTGLAYIKRSDNNLMPAYA